jgi:hypothetical protein
VIFGAFIGNRLLPHNHLLITLGPQGTGLDVPTVRTTWAAQKRTFAKMK